MTSEAERDDIARFRNTVKDPYATDARLRSRGAVVELPELATFVVLGASAVREVLSDPGTYGQGYAGPAELTGGGAAPPGAFPQTPSLVNADPPVHTRQRRILTTAWNPNKGAEALDTRIRQVAGELVDRFPSDCEFDLVEALAFPLPVTIIAEIMGVPLGRRDDFKRWSVDLLAPLAGPLTAERRHECGQSLAEFHRFFAAEIENRRGRPPRDLLGHLLTAGGSELSIPELLSMLIQMLVGGHETTTAHISSVFFYILSRPTLCDMLRSDPAKIDLVIEEVLRLEPPTQFVFRRTRRPANLGGVELPEGANLIVSLASANRDEVAYPDPHTPDLDRDGVRQHLAFGRGIHFCVGAPLARKEGRIAVETVLDNFPSIRLAPDCLPQYHENPVVRSMSSLRVVANGRG